MIIKKFIWSLVFLVFISTFQNKVMGSSIYTPTKSGWDVGELYLTYNRKPVFLSGVNYIPSKEWLMILEKWDEKAIEEDLSSLSKLGVKYIRFCPLWHLTQPKINKLEPEKLKRIDKIVEIAGKYGIYVQIGPITGWMSGATFLPEWAYGNIFTDPEIIKGETFLVKEIANRYKDNPSIQGYDFGNEVNVLYEKMDLGVTEEEMDKWMQTIYKAYKDADPEHPIVNGVGSEVFNIWAISKSSDYMCVHYYPYFAETYLYDPWIGQRTTYGSNYMNAWAKMTGRPVLIQELGCSEEWMPRDEIPDYLRITYISNWADGAAGYFWWCSHDINRDYRIFTDGLYLEYSHKSFEEGEFSELEYTLGLLTENNEIKPSGIEYKKCVEIIDRLGLGWKELSPVCYIIVHEDTDDYSEEEMISYPPFFKSPLNSYVLAKQNHLNVKLLPDGRNIPDDANAVVIPNLSLSKKGKEKIELYLKNGGTVFQSYFKDFATNIKVKGTEKIVGFPEIMVTKREGDVEIGQNIRIPVNLKIRNVDISGDVDIILKIFEDKQERFEWNAGEGLFFKTKVGEGDYYYLATNLEQAFMQEYNPWKEDNSNLIYSVLKKENDIDINSKYVELFHKSRGNEELVILINHSDSFQDIILKSKDRIQLIDAFSKEKIGNGIEIYLNLKPAEVLVAYIVYLNN